MASTDRRKKASGGEENPSESRNFKASLNTNILDLLEERMTDDDDGSTLKEYLRKLKRSRQRREKRLKNIEKKKERDSLMKMSSKGPEHIDNQNLRSSALPAILPIKEEEEELSINSLKANIKLIYGYGPSKFQSSSSLQRSIPSISFSKSERFKNPSPLKSLPNASSIIESSLINTPSSLSSQSHATSTPKIMASTIRGASMGLGLRIGCISEKRLKEEALRPGPGQYNLRTEKPNRQRIISLPFFEQRCIDSSLLYNKEPTPGPGRYDISKPLMKTDGSFMLKSILTDRDRKKSGKFSINDNSLKDDSYRCYLAKENSESSYRRNRGKIRFDDEVTKENPEKGIKKEELEQS